jgi:hypothetical protein
LGRCLAEELKQKLVRFFVLAFGRFKEAAQHGVIFQALEGSCALDDLAHDHNERRLRSAWLLVGGTGTPKAGEEMLLLRAGQPPRNFSAAGWRSGWRRHSAWGWRRNVRPTRLAALVRQRPPAAQGRSDRTGWPGGPGLYLPAGLIPDPVPGPSLNMSRAGLPLLGSERVIDGVGVGDRGALKALTQQVAGMNHFSVFRGRILFTPQIHIFEHPASS